MPGKNRVLKSGQTLFNAGDASDGMYLVRKGQLKVFLRDEDREVTLARIGDGQLIGEMALFDRKPRSASVKAENDTEITHITNDDFSALVKQIPKWFVSLMTTLSTRLRVTNERLQKLETGRNKGEAFLHVTRILHVINLLWSKDGVKEGKEWQIEKDPTLQMIHQMFGDKIEQLDALGKTLAKHGLIEERFNSYRAAVYSARNRGVMEQFVHFFTVFVKRNNEHPYLDDGGIELLECLAKIADGSAYEKVTAGFEDLEIEGKKNRMQVGRWKNSLPLLKTCAPDQLKMVKTSSGGLGFRTTKKDVHTVLRYHRCIADLFKMSGF